MRIRKRYLALSIFCSLAAGFFNMQSASAEEVSASVIVARGFVGNCVLNVGRNDKVAAGAKVLGYEELAGDMKTMFAPQDPKAKYSVWLVRDEINTHFVLGISEGIVDGIEMNSCVISNPSIAIESVIHELKKLIQFGRVIDDFENSGQRYRFWSTPSIESGSWITVTDAAKLDIIGGSVTLSAPKQR